MELLDEIKKENDIKKIDERKLPTLAGEIREFLIDSVSRTGGHLASNLGAVELTMALHLCMDFPKDKIVWDVGHQAYTHKILTGRKDGFKNLRQLDGMSGFPKTCESASDSFNTGHSSTSISAAIGMAFARDMRGSDEKICAVIGDGSLTGGMAYEALNQLAQMKTNLVVILNDNEMSIGRNVGGLSRSLNNIRVGHAYNDFKSNVEQAILNIPDVGYKMAKKIKQSKDAIKNILVPGMFFEELGITYVGPIDGHNIEWMVQTINDAFLLNKPIVVHVKTMKGKGYRYAEKYPEHFHGVEPFCVETGKPLDLTKKVSWTDAFSKKLVSLGDENEKIVGITAAMAKGTGIDRFQKKYPDRTFDVGIAEQHAVTFAAGLAMGGYIPVVAIYSSFLQRAYDQILHDVCLQNLHVIFAVDRSGLVGSDGETHHGIYDTSYLTGMPNLTVIAPKNKQELNDALEYAVKCDGPVAIKYGRGPAYTGLSGSRAPFETGVSEVINEGKKLAILFSGSMAETAVNIRNRFEIEHGFKPGLINLRFLKPLDKELIIRHGKEYGTIAVLEECIEAGSTGEKIAKILISEDLHPRFKHYCLKDEKVRHGKCNELRAEEGISEDFIIEDLLKVDDLLS